MFCLQIVLEKLKGCFVYPSRWINLLHLNTSRRPWGKHTVAGCQYFFLIIVPSGQVSKLATCNRMHLWLPENKRLQKPSVSHVHVLDSEQEASAVGCLSFLVSQGEECHSSQMSACCQSRSKCKTNPVAALSQTSLPNPTTTTTTNSTTPTWSNKRSVCEWKPSSVILKKSSLPQWFSQTGEASGTASTLKEFRLNQGRKKCILTLVSCGKENVRITGLTFLELLNLTFFFKCPFFGVCLVMHLMSTRGRFLQEHSSLPHSQARDSSSAGEEVRAPRGHSFLLFFFFLLLTMLESKLNIDEPRNRIAR